MVYFKKDNQNYIFVHIPKTAGISISEALIKNIDNAEYISTKRETKFKSVCKSNLTEFIYSPFYDHIPAWYINPVLKINYA